MLTVFSLIHKGLWSRARYARPSNFQNIRRDQRHLEIIRLSHWPSGKLKLSRFAFCSTLKQATRILLRRRIPQIMEGEGDHQL